MTGQRVGYIRVSTVDQSEARQLDGVPVDETFTDKASGRDRNRPALTEMMKYVRNGDRVLVHSLDRLGRNEDELRALIDELNDLGADSCAWRRGGAAATPMHSVVGCAVCC
ncbi:hypothetical protein NCCP2495_25090 [Dietzia sp. NCCP-2495]|uniref:recombinase family protein n=1 Tax=Dietzia sp. NCCP-2495 TaxID=2934675 RepID=UPI002231E230|nr:recombinase family protein [Dietzia sp. NCCP-2495]GLB64630.1 hypothetical protein NCCP2495_25090 [Dietzia sp. NCCP-2495]